MPKVKVNGETFLASWPKDGDKILRAVAKKYKRGKTIRWLLAESEGALNGVLNVSIKKIRHRYSFLKFKRKIYAKRRKQGQESVDNSHYTKKRMTLQQAAGYKSNRIQWLLEDETLLYHLTGKYTVNKRIKWKLLVNDKEAKKLPSNNIKLLSSTYNRFINQSAHRKSALKWKKKNRQRFNETVKKRLKKKRRLIRQFLWKKIGVR
jgi:hypothetical protein